ncbi:MAG: hypothetical protein JJU05_07670 [Verrucomicrobia bacterium]|nr:hypothetical protein [Verrucomicrobiota bacterium]MCH8528743.1 GDSL-type esterase/lipase family protein [Kiritimatiellia bacterium]
MIHTHDSIEFHNVAALETRAGMPGLALARVPLAVRKHLNTGARYTGAESTGVELRFMTDAPLFRIAFAAHDKEVNLEIYRGGFEYASKSIAPGAVRMFDLGNSEQMNTFDLSDADTGPFAPALWRILLSRGGASYVGIDAPGFSIRPPDATEKPRLRWLAYGSSITHSWSRGYPHIAARELGVDVLNKGLAGSCQFEAELAEHFVTAETWDFATLELGVNVRGVFSAETFRERATRFVDRLREARPEAPVALITHYLNRDHFPHRQSGQTEAGRIQEAYDDILRELAARGDANLHLFEGREILKDPQGLTCDLLHPGQYGHIQMGHNLAEKLSPLLTRL